MSGARVGWKVLGVCGVVVGLVGVAIGLAQAESGAKWTVVEVAVKAGVEISSLEGGTGTLLTKVVGKNVEVSCTAVTAIGMNLESEGKVTEGSKVKFTGCITNVEGIAQTACKPKSGGELLGTIVTNELKGLLVLHEEAGGKKIGLTRLEPKTGETFAAVELGEKCGIGETLPVRGKLFLKDTALETTSREHLVTQGPLTDLWVLNKTAEHAASLDGSLKAALSEAHTAFEWGGTPG
jgi:hypothetical protein